MTWPLVELIRNITQR